jgi:cell wall assembly regulator SMI1
MELTGLGAFNRAWDRFEGWLATNMPDEHATLRPPATAEEISSVETTYGFPLHPELKALLQRHNGVYHPNGRAPGAFLPGRHRLNSTDQISSDRSILVQFSEEFSENWGESPVEAVVAHARRWVTFAEPNDGGMVFVDHRPGPTYGRVYEFGMGTGASDATEWAISLTELFDAITAALETNTSFKHYSPAFGGNPSGQQILNW